MNEGMNIVYLSNIIWKILENNKIQLAHGIICLFSFLNTDLVRGSQHFTVA